MHAKKVLTFIIKQATFSWPDFCRFLVSIWSLSKIVVINVFWANPITSELRLNFKPLDKEFNLLSLTLPVSLYYT